MTQEPPEGHAVTGREQGPALESVRERTRQQLLYSLGGWSGTVVAAVPPVVFVAVNATAGLRPAIFAAVGAGVLAALYRVVRRQPLQQALSGLFSVLVAAIIAGRSGQARDYFLVGIITAFLCAAVLAGSLIVRRPLVGLIWEFLDPTSLREDEPWFGVQPLRRAYDLATVAGLLVFLARGIVQFGLFHQNQTGWLAVARISMGYPLYIAFIGFAFWIVRRARHRLAVAGLLTEPADD